MKNVREIVRGTNITALEFKSKKFTGNLTFVHNHFQFDKDVLDKNGLPLGSGSSGGATDTVIVSDPASESVHELRNTQQEINIDTKDSVNFLDSRVTQNEDKIATLVSSSIVLVHPSSSYIPESEEVWDFSVGTPSSNTSLLDADGTSNTVMFKKANTRYVWSTELIVKTHGRPDKTLTFRVKNKADDSIIKERIVLVDGGNNKVNYLSLPPLFYDNIAADLELYVTFEASDDEVEILNAESNIVVNTTGTASNTDFIEKLIKLNRDTDLFLADASLRIVEAPPIVDVPTSEIPWEFTIDLDSTNDLLLRADDTANEITLRRDSIKYNWDTIVQIRNSSSEDITFTIRVRKKSDGTIIQERQLSILANTVEYNITIPVLNYKNTESDTIVYPTISASGDGITILDASSRIYATTSTVHSNLIHWAGTWESGNTNKYFPNDMVRSGAWLSLALTENTSVPYPKHSNTIDFVIDYDGASWEEITESRNEVKTGMLFKVPSLGWMHGARTWLIDDPTIEQTVIMGVITVEGNFVILDRRVISNDMVPAGGGFVEFLFDKPVFMLEGTYVRCGILTKSLFTTIDRENGYWKSAGIKESTDPVWWGAFAVNAANSFLQIHENQTDSLGIKDLSVIEAGDYVKFVANQAEWIFIIDTPLGKNGSVWEFEVHSNFMNGAMPSNTSIQMTAYYYGPGSEVKYVRVLNYVSPYDNLTGLKDEVPNDNLYATDFYFEEGIVNSDWEVLATLGEFEPQTVTKYKQFLISKITGEEEDVQVGDSLYSFRTPFAGDILDIRASVNEAPVGLPIVVDIKLEGNSIFEVPLQIDENSKTSVGASIPFKLLNDRAFADDVALSIDVMQIGSTTPGKGLKVTILALV